MLEVDSYNKDKLVYFLLAELSLIVITLIILTSNPVDVSYSFPRVIFALICAFGIVAGISPTTFSLGRSERPDGNGVSGHHPECTRFAGHTVNLFGSRRCAGCTGLIFGALLSLAGLFLMSPTRLVGEQILWLGVLFVGLGLGQHYIDLGNGWIHLGLNILLVTGSWLLFDYISIQRLGLPVQFYFLSITVFWIWARIRLSQFTHISVCAGCTEHCTHIFT